MHEREYHRSRGSRKAHGTLTIIGHAIRITVRRHALQVEDGFRSEGPTRSRIVHRALDPIDRILLLAASGTLTVSALDWAAENDVPVIACDQAGRLRWSVLPGNGGQWRSTLRRAQAVAPFTSIGVEIAQWLLAKKIQRQQAVLHILGVAADKLATIAERVSSHERHQDAIAQLRHLESQAAELYWSAWAGLQIQFAPLSYARTIPDHWRIFTSRHSPLSGGARLAVSPINALLNFGYALLAAETLIACHGAGLDPNLGVIHTDKDARFSFLYDLMEPVRPVVDRIVLDHITTRPFRRGELWALRNATCRLDQDFAASLGAEWIPRVRREVTLVVERAASMLRRARITPEQHPAHTAKTVPLTGACPECGAPVRPGRRFCSAACYQVWWRANVQRRISAEGTETLAKLRAQGRDPSHSGEATRKRSRSVSEAKRYEWMTLSAAERSRRTRPATLARWSTRPSLDQTKRMPKR